MQNKLKDVFDSHGIIAYPTEAVFGLGCNPFDEIALQRLIELKQRNPEQGFIVIAATYAALAPFIQMLPKENMKAVLASWPGPHTWLFPAQAGLPAALTGKHDNIAVRVTNHPIAKKLCEEVGPIVSTSANRSGEPPCKTAEEVRERCATGIDLIIDGSVGSQEKPTCIQDAATGEILRY